MMKKKILYFLLAFTFLAALPVSAGLFTHSAASSVYDVDTVAYRARVIADGGIVISMTDVAAAIKHAKANGYWSSVAFWTSAQFGVKKDGAGAVSTLYDLKGNDATQGTGSAQPIWTANQQNGRAGIMFDGGDYLALSGTGLNLTRNVSSITIGAALATTKPGTLAVIIYIATAGPGVTRSRLTRESVAGQLSGGGRRLDADAFAEINGGSFTANVMTFDMTILDYANSNADLYSNGSSIANTESFQTNGSTSDVASSEISIGSAHNGAFRYGYINGKIGDLFVLTNMVPTMAQRQSIESFQNQKWAIY